jgi:MFS family permease
VRDLQRSNIVRLATAQALGGGNSVIVYATGAVVGDVLAPDKSLATLPISIFVIGMAICTLPAGIIAQRFGRRPVFMLGALCGGLMGLMAALGIYLSSFVIFSASMLLAGAYAAMVLSLRFAAAECVPEERQPRALSIVMAAGLVAGVVGPQTVTFTMHLWSPYLFMATYVAAAVMAVVSAVALQGVVVHHLPIIKRHSGRPMSALLKQPRLLLAMLYGVISYMLMNFLMTSAPLAMKHEHLPVESSNLALQWHVIAMYAPSFFTGALISRLGATRVVVMGLMFTGASAVVGMLGVQAYHFYLSLMLLGIGWNFGFVGASALVLQCHEPDERNRVQALNDFVVFGAMVLGSFASGGLLNRYGWKVICGLAFLPLVLGLGTLLIDRYRLRYGTQISSS